jgi:hypothetical protein
MARQRRLDRDLGGLDVADLPDQDDVGVLADDVSQPGREGEADLRAHRNLVHALQLVLDRVLDGDDLAIGRVDLVERAIERGRLAGAGGAGHEQDAVGARDQRLEAPADLGREAELLQRQEHARAIEEPHHDRFAVAPWERSRRGYRRAGRAG